MFTKIGPYTLIILSSGTVVLRTTQTNELVDRFDTIGAAVQYAMTEGK